MVLEVIWLHFFSDFVLQSDTMAKNKSSSNKWLLIHCAIYTAPFLWFGWKYAAINGAAHFVTDWITSRGTAALWQKGERHWFFVLIGLDQAVHMTALVATAGYAL